ncbi:MAG: response regulator [Proteobacteria bacterium]|nr:MAG: response regulator [Pseudomonadota bacterium]RYZ70569.1 MAG: response regulator [Pseudomonadota bacterium]
MDRKLLIVDDEVDLCELLSEISRPVATTILTACNGEEALEIVRSMPKNSPIDAILSDISMPKKNGIEFLSELRFLGVYTPFIFLTGYGDKEKMATAIKYGAFDFFDKPANNKALVSRLDEALSFGVLLRSLDDEVDDLMGLAPEGVEDHEKLREALASVLIVRKQREAAMKKSA